MRRLGIITVLVTVLVTALLMGLWPAPQRALGEPGGGGLYRIDLGSGGHYAFDLEGGSCDYVPEPCPEAPVVVPEDGLSRYNVTLAGGGQSNVIYLAEDHCISLLLPEGGGGQYQIFYVPRDGQYMVHIVPLGGEGQYVVHILPRGGGGQYQVQIVDQGAGR